MTEREARKLTRKHQESCYAGWLLACDSPSNRITGQRMINSMTFDDANTAITYRDYCIKMYSYRRYA